MPIYQLIGSSTPNSVARAIANEIVQGKNAIATALINRGQLVESTETMQDMANRIGLIVGQITVTPLQGIPAEWHDLAQVIAANTLVDYPYSFAILLTKGMQSIKLTGSQAFICSDSGVLYGDQDHTFDVTKDTVGADTHATWTGLLAGMSTPITVTANTTGSVGNIRLVGNGTSLASIVGLWNATHLDNTLTITGDGSQIPTSRFYGVTNGLITPIDIRENSGGDFGTITLAANSIKTVATLISDWNAANPTKQITLISGTGTQVPTSDIILGTENITLAGGVIGNIGKSTRWVIFLNNTWNRSPSYNFSSIINLQGITAIGKIITVCFNNILLTNLTFSETLVSSIYFSFTGLTAIVLPIGIFRHSSIVSVKIPSGVISLNIKGEQNSDGAFALSTLSSIEIPETVTDLTLGSSSFEWSQLKSFKTPSNLLSLSLSYGAFGGNSYLSYVFLGCPKNSLFMNDSVFTFCSGITILELQKDWNWTAFFYYGFSTLSVSSINGIFASIVDKRKDGINPSTVTTSTTSAIVTAVNGNFTKVFRPGDNITIAAGASRTISSITDDNTLILQSNAATTGIGQSYNINKTMQINSVGSKMSPTEILIATNKGWTIS